MDGKTSKNRDYNASRRAGELSSEIFGTVALAMGIPVYESLNFNFKTEGARHGYLDRFREGDGGVRGQSKFRKPASACRDSRSVILTAHASGEILQSDGCSRHDTWGNKKANREVRRVPEGT